jgi:hypothetical protein
MHATFLSKRWENKHVLYGVQDTVKIKIFFLSNYYEWNFMDFVTAVHLSID